MNKQENTMRLDKVQKMCPTLTAASMVVNQEDFNRVEDVYEICIGRKCGQYKLCQVKG